MLELKVLWQTLGLNYGAHSTAKIVTCLPLLLQLAQVKSLAVKLTTGRRCQDQDESCHPYRHVNNFTDASFTIKFSLFPHTRSTACMYFIAERRPYILKSWFLLKAIFNCSAKLIWKSHYAYIWLYHPLNILNSSVYILRILPPLCTLTRTRRPCFFSIYCFLIAHS